ncbi:hypothetical protein ACWKW1_13055 [Brevibacillus parabrevis]
MLDDGSHRLFIPKAVRLPRLVFADDPESSVFRIPVAAMILLLASAIAAGSGFSESPVKTALLGLRLLSLAPRLLCNRLETRNHPTYIGGKIASSIDLHTKAVYITVCILD